MDIIQNIDIDTIGALFRGLNSLKQSSSIVQPGSVKQDDTSELFDGKNSRLL